MVSCCDTFKALSTLATIVAEFGDCRQNRRLLATVAKRPVHTGDYYSRTIRRLPPKPATVAEFAVFWWQSPFSATNCRRKRRL